MASMLKKAIFILTLCGVTASMGIFAHAPYADAQAYPSADYIAIPEEIKAPNISWQDATGNTLSLADYKGKVILLNFWATWCGPCVIEMPHLNNVQKKYRLAGLEVVPISIDKGGVNSIQKFYDRHKLSQLQIAADPESRTPGKYQVSSLPVSYLISDKGILLGTVQGYADWSKSPHSTEIQKALQKRAGRLATTAQNREVPTVIPVGEGVAVQ